MDGFVKIEIENGEFTVQVRYQGVKQVYQTNELIEEDVTQSDWIPLSHSEADFLLFEVGVSPKLSGGFPNSIPVPSDFSLEGGYFTDDGAEHFTHPPVAEEVDGWLGIDYRSTGEIRKTTTWPTSPDGFGISRKHLAFRLPIGRSMDDIHRLKLICETNSLNYTCWLAGGHGVIMPQDRIL